MGVAEKLIFGGGYPAFPHKETAVFRKVYGESRRKDLDIGPDRSHSYKRPSMRGKSFGLSQSIQIPQ